jgi:hypothetical protein
MIIHGAAPKTDPEIIKTRVAAIAEAFLAARVAMHAADGTQPGNPMGGREMRIAADHLDTAWLWAKHAVESN